MAENKHIHRWRVAWDEQAAICDDCPDAAHLEKSEIEARLNWAEPTVGFVTEFFALMEKTGAALTGS